MAKGTPSKPERNKKIVELKPQMTFRALGAMFHISSARVKEIYDREVKKQKEGKKL
jgi:hypothetical protein